MSNSYRNSEEDNLQIKDGKSLALSQNIDIGQKKQTQKLCC